MKFLLIPGNNSLSHIAKCLAVWVQLRAKGQDVCVAVTRANAGFLNHLHCPCTILPDIQESDLGPAPSLAWFRDIERIRRVIRAEMDLMARFRPDRVLGVFRFTTKIAAARMGIPYDALICGCMQPDNSETLGFAADEAGAAYQRQYLDNFFRFAGRKIALAAGTPDDGKVPDARRLLEGERTFLWDFPEFMPLPPSHNRHYTGPLKWQHWPGSTGTKSQIDSQTDSKIHKIDIDDRHRYALITFGTCCGAPGIAERLIGCLLDQGYHLIIAAGNQPELVRLNRRSRRITIFPFVPLQKLLPFVDLVVTHGGQMTLFEALQHGVPAVVLPFQPEQAHNGVCLERIGCGRRLIPSVPYRGDGNVYIDAFMGRSRTQLCRTIETLLHDPDMPARLDRTRQALQKYTGAPMLADHLIQVHDDA